MTENENEELKRLEVVEKLSKMQAYEEIPFKFKPIGTFSPEMRPQKAVDKDEEQAELERAKTRLATEMSKYRDLLKKKYVADSENLKNYVSVQSSKDKANLLQKECRALQAKNKEIEAAGKRCVDAINLKTSELEDSVSKSIESISKTVEKDEEALQEKEKKLSELLDALQKARKHRELQIQQKEAVQNATKLQAQIGEAKGAQRAHALTQLESKRQLARERVASKQKKHDEYKICCHHYLREMRP